MIALSEEKYAVFKALFQESLVTSYNNAHLARCLATLMSKEANHWKVIGITENALIVLRENNFEKPANRSLQRGHLIPRSDLAGYIFRGRQEFISKAEFEKVYSFYDKTVLMTAEENKSSKNPPSFYLFREDLDLFQSQYIGFRYGEAEKQFLIDFDKTKSSVLKTIGDVYPKKLDTHKS